MMKYLKYRQIHDNRFTIENIYHFFTMHRALYLAISVPRISSDILVINFHDYNAWLLYCAKICIQYVNMTVFLYKYVQYVNINSKGRYGAGYPS